MKRVRVILSEEAEEVYKYLNEHASESKIEKSILNSINKKVELINLTSTVTTKFINNFASE